MKALVILALAVFTGCQANKSNKEELNPHLEQLTHAFWNYLVQAIQTNDEPSQMIRTSQMGQEVKLTETPPSKDPMTKITKEAEVLRERLSQDLITVRDKLKPYADNLKSQIQQRVEELRAAMTPYAESLDSETLKATLLQKSEELQAQLEPYTAELKGNVYQNLQEMKRYFAASTEDLQAQI